MRPSDAAKDAVGGIEPDLDAAWNESVRGKLIAWYREAGRDLPWRRDRDPYRILVSEMMLVQTTVTAVVPFFERFLRRFPDVRTLAFAPELEVLKAWEGLGFYRRARQLQAAARLIVESHGGRIPDDPDAIRSLPGVGRYMTGAILSFAFDRPEPILEANSQRVFARLLAWEHDVKINSSQARLWRAAERMVPDVGAGAFNQAVMDLGASICTPRQPACLVCPLASLCQARLRGLQDKVPLISPKPPALEVREACALVVYRHQLLVAKRESRGLWADFWEFPTINLGGADPAARSFGEPVDLEAGVRRLTGIRARIGVPVTRLSYSVTKHRVQLRVHLGEGLGGRLQPGPGLSEVAWVDPRALGELTFGSAGRRLVTRIVAKPSILSRE